MRCNPEGGGFPDFSKPLPNGDPATNCLPFAGKDYGMGKPKPSVPDHDGTIHAGSTQWTTHDRTGFDFSNRMTLADNLRLTIGGSYQQEKLRERVQNIATGGSAGGLAFGGSELHQSTRQWGPRSGKRKEYSAMLSLDWQPTHWLTLTAGARYMRYSAKDTGLAERRRQQDAKFAAAQRLAGLELAWKEIMQPDDKAKLDQLYQDFQDAWAAVDVNDPANFKSWDFIYHSNGGGDIHQTNVLPTENAALRAAGLRFSEFLSSHHANPFVDYSRHTLLNANESDNIIFTLLRTGGGSSHDTKYNEGGYWIKKTVVPAKDGKFDSSRNPFANGEIDPNELVDDPQGSGTKVARIIPTGQNTGTPVYQRLDAGKQWEMPAEQSGEAWSPVLSATARITPHSTLFVRHAQTVRFPSIFEYTTTPSGVGVASTFSTNSVGKPERSINWEFGYAHDLTQFFPRLGFADARISYYHTDIKNFIDRNRYLDTIQFDKYKSRGIEFQSRFDSGRFFGSLGVNYRLSQKLCDKDYASGMDPFYNRVPTCMTGGFPDTITSTTLQPRYSINMALGTRLLNDQLELGWQGTYHAKTENKELDRFLRSPGGYDVWRYHATMRPLYAKSVLLHDIYARYNVNKNLAINLGITNLTDEYYMDPMSKVILPGPGRTVTLGVTAKF